MRRKWGLRQVLSGLLSAAMLAASLPGTAMAASVSDDPDTCADKASLITEASSIEALGDGNEYGTLSNGDFADGTNDWTVTGLEVNVNEYMPDGYKDQNYLYKWADSETDIGLTQTVSNMKPGTYTLSVDAGGTYKAGSVSVSVTSGDDTLAEMTPEAGSGWGVWSRFTTSSFVITAENNGSVVIGLSGKIGADGSEDVHIDNIVIEAIKTVTDLQNLYSGYLETCSEYSEEDPDGTTSTVYTAESWAVFCSAMSAAKALIDNESTDVDEINGAYTALHDAADGLEELPAEDLPEFTFYYYAPAYAEEDIGVFGWASWAGLSSTGAGVWSYGGNWSDKDVTMNKSSVPGWFYVTLTADPSVNSAGFELHPESNTDSALFVCSYSYDGSETYARLISGDHDVYAYKNGVLYEADMADAPNVVTTAMSEITLNVFDDEGTPVIGSCEPLHATAISEGVAIAAELEADKYVEADHGEDAYFYYMTEDTDNENWYSLTFSIPAVDNAGDPVVSLYSMLDGVIALPVRILCNGETSGENCTDISRAIIGRVYYKDGTLYDSRPLALDKLADKLLDIKNRADAIYTENEEAEVTYYKTGEHEETWNAFVTARETAGSVLTSYENNTLDEGSASDTLQRAYDGLDAAIRGLAMIPAESDSIHVNRVVLDDDFITGADLSSYISLKQSGVEFRNENGDILSDEEFFEYLAAGGTNWARIRVWNDPYDAGGRGYGGGNNDINKAIQIGRLATNAGMRVLIDFHYSDFWADPGKQQAPKAWSSYSIDKKETALYDFTLSSLKKLGNAGVDVGMVQIGNETNGGICGESSWTNMGRLFKKGAEAVRAYSAECGSDVLVAVHFTNPEKQKYSQYAANLAAAGVDYDVFASSYYPFWHQLPSDTGTDHLTRNLTEELSKVATDYGKKVMVAETSWATTWSDGDGHENSAPKISDDLDYDISVQGQADEVRDVVAAVASIDQGIGVFYWEPAWLSKYYAYDPDGGLNQSVLAQNKALWEKHGSGWAASYASEYDPTDAGLWYGGSAIDNQSWFAFDGTALATAKIYSYIRTGAVFTGDISVSSAVTRLTLDNVSIGTPVADVLEAAQANTAVTLSDGTSYTYADDPEHFGFVWDRAGVEAFASDTIGTGKITGRMSVKYSLQDGTETSESFDISLTFTIVPSDDYNMLVSPGFEGSNDKWSVNGELTWINGEDPRSGSKGAHFWKNDVIEKETVHQTTDALPGGTYALGAYIQGNGAGPDDYQYLYATVQSPVTDADGNPTGEYADKLTYRTKCQLSGYLNWQNPTLTAINVEDGDRLEVGMEINSTEAGAWGTIDDFYLYGNYPLTVNKPQHGTLILSTFEAMGGSLIGITAKPAAGYALRSVSIEGAGITGSVLGSDHTVRESVYDPDTRTDTLIFEDADGVNPTGPVRASFEMQNSDVTVSAEFVSVFEGTEGKIDISGDDVTVLNTAVRTVDEKDILFLPDMKHTGTALYPAVTVEYRGYKLTSSDLKITYANNKNAGTAVITLTGKGNRFTGTRKVYFDILTDNRTALSDKKAIAVSLDGSVKKVKGLDVYYYEGDKIEPAVTVTLIGKEGETVTEDQLIRGTDYELTYQDNIRTGTATIAIVATASGSKVKGSTVKKFTIARCPVSELTVSRISGTVYTGSAIKPALSVKHGRRILKAGTDYTVKYTSNTNSGTGYITVRGKGSYTGITSVYPGTQDKISFAIAKRSINDATVTLGAQDLTAGKKSQSPKLSLKHGTKTLKSGQYSIIRLVRKADPGDAEDTVIYDATAAKPGKAQVKETGTYEVTVQGKGSYTGSRTAAFRVLAAAKSLSSATVTTSDQLYTGSAVTLRSTGDKPSLTVKKGNDILTEGEDYEVRYSNNTKPGKATVTITGKGDYGCSKSKTFKIKKRKLPDVYSWSFTENDLFGAERPYTGYAWTPDLVIKVNIGTEAEPVIRTLKKGTDYSITFRNNLKADTTAAGTAKAYAVIKGKGGYSGSKTIRDIFDVKDTTLGDYVISIDPVTYTGKAIKPAVRFTYKATGTVIPVKAKAAYTISYGNNRQVSGKLNAPYVYVKEKGMNVKASTRNKTGIKVGFTINPGKITSAGVKDIPIQVYAGKAVTPKLTVKAGGKTLKAGTDYIVTFSGNDGRGQAYATVTGIGNYAGSVVRSFTVR